MIPHSRPTLDEEDAQRVLDVVRSGQLVQGREVAAFEKELAETVGLFDAVAVSSGTAALHLALRALEIGPGDEVLIPSFVCTALLHAVRQTGASPVLADCDPATYNLSPTDAKRRITPRTRAVIVPHLFGQAADLEAIQTLGLPVIEDCAQSLGSLYHQQPTGGFGVLAVFSFYATKVIATGEGGMVSSRDTALLERIRDLRDYDEKEEDTQRYNCKMTDMQAALGRSQLRKLPAFIARRQAIAAVYSRAFAPLGLAVPATGDNRTHIYYRYILRHDNASGLMAALEGLGIAARRPVFRPLHAYLGEKGYPEAEEVWRETLSLPLYPSLSEDETERIVSAMTSLFAKGLECHVLL